MPARDVAEQVLAHALLGEVIAFEVEEDVVGRGLGQEREAVLGIERPFQLVVRRAAVAAALLDARLVAEARQRLAGSARGLGHRIERRQGREPCRRRARAALLIWALEMPAT